jgi:hypothetical protein
VRTRVAHWPQARCQHLSLARRDRFLSPFERRSLQFDRAKLPAALVELAIASRQLRVAAFQTRRERIQLCFAGVELGRVDAKPTLYLLGDGCGLGRALVELLRSDGQLCCPLVELLNPLRELLFGLAEARRAEPPEQPAAVERVRRFRRPPGMSLVLAHGRFWLCRRPGPQPSRSDRGRRRVASSTPLGPLLQKGSSLLPRIPIPPPWTLEAHNYSPPEFGRVFRSVRRSSSSRTSTVSCAPAIAVSCTTSESTEASSSAGKAVPL